MKPGPRLIGDLWYAAIPATLEAVTRDGEPWTPGPWRRKFLLAPDVAQAFRALHAEGRSRGHRLRIVSAYRDPAHQEKLFARAVLKYGSEAEARKWVAKHSEHATGRTIDFGLGISNSSANARSGKFDRLPIVAWLREAAPRHGWTNYVREPWHYTFNAISG